MPFAFLRQVLGESNFNQLHEDLTGEAAREKVDSFVEIGPLLPTFDLRSDPVGDLILLSPLACPTTTVMYGPILHQQWEVFVDIFGHCVRLDPFVPHALSPPNFVPLLTSFLDSQRHTVNTGYVHPGHRTLTERERPATSTIVCLTR